MSANANEKQYKELDLSKIVFGETVPTSEALSDVEPIIWPDEVLNGTSRVIVTNVSTERDKDRRYV